MSKPQQSVTCISKKKMFDHADSDHGKFSPNKKVLLRDRKRRTARAPNLVMTVQTFLSIFFQIFLSPKFFVVKFSGGGGGTPVVFKKGLLETNLEKYSGLPPPPRKIIGKKIGEIRDPPCGQTHKVKHVRSY